MLAKFDFAIAYMNDIIVVSKSADENRQHLLLLFETIAEYGFQGLKLKVLLLPRLNQISGTNHRQEWPLSRSEENRRMPPPTDIPSIRSYLGMVNFYQPHVSDLVNLRKSLDLLLLKDKLWD
uniref:Reverse transcriptase domain-containing protein n=1 Tax=Ditylenchus dipsaci TaxID=166011 RepID=A0A915E9W3_9BILA